MSWANRLTKFYLNQRLSAMQAAIDKPEESQKKILKKIIAGSQHTIWGEKYFTQEIQNCKDYSEAIPVQSYTSLFPYIERMMRGEKNILWNQPITWFAQSSGTSNAKSKWIPVCSAMLYEGHYKAGRDVMSWYIHQQPNSKIFDGKSLIIGGTFRNINQENVAIKGGDISAVMMANLPWIGAYFHVLPKSIAAHPNWEEKIKQIYHFSSKKNIAQIAGVPSWTLLLLKFILHSEQKKYINEVWKNLELYVHGGVSFAPYKNEFKELFHPAHPIKFCETYNASEGFFGIQNNLDADDLLLLTNHGVYYELLPLSELEQTHPKCIFLEDAKINTTYALVISTLGGLWRYVIGDTIQFTSVFPFRFKIMGRTQHYINTFGEELMVANAEKALEIATKKCNAKLTEFTVAPQYLKEGKGLHEWFIEWQQAPENLEHFAKILDDSLQHLNSDYAAKRHQNLILQLPKIHTLPKNTFYQWLKNKNKLGGQNKIQRLSPHRVFAEELLILAANKCEGEG